MYYKPVLDLVEKQMTIFRRLLWPFFEETQGKIWNIFVYMIKKQMLTFLISSPPIRLSSNRRVSMGLTNSRKTAKRLTVSRKKVNCIKIPGGQWNDMNGQNFNRKP